MSWFNTIAILFVAYLAIFFQVTFNECRHLVSVQLIFPARRLRGAQRRRRHLHGRRAVRRALDRLSLGESARDQPAPAVPRRPGHSPVQRIDPARPAVCPIHPGPLRHGRRSARHPRAVDEHGHSTLVGSWFSLWQWIAMSIVGGAVTPLWFFVFNRIGDTFNYRPWGESSFRPDRQIKRGRQ